MTDNTVTSRRQKDGGEEADGLGRSPTGRGDSKPSSSLAILLLSTASCDIASLLHPDTGRKCVNDTVP
jgi:hypothetical protein